MIQIKNIAKSYKQGATSTVILRDVNLLIREGEFVTIMGPSGAGKSTLLSILGMLDATWSGEYFLLGQAVHKLPPRQRIELNKKYVGFVFQQFHLLEDLKVYENLDVPLSYRSMKRTDRDKVVQETLERFQITNKKHLYPSQLSGGQQQLVAVARALIANPKLILADEPTGNLHSTQGEGIMDLFKQLNTQGTTIIQVTHSEKNASYGNRVINLYDGMVMDEAISGQRSAVGCEM